MITYASIVADILNREGRKYTNIAGDMGGPTKFGITQATLSDYLGRQASIVDVQNLTEQLATKIYMQLYIVRPGYDRLNNPELTVQLIDAGVQHGTTKAICLLQRSVRVPESGTIGMSTIQAVAKLNPLAVTLNFMAARAHYYGEILLNETNQQFAAGWFNRFGNLITVLAQDQVWTVSKPSAENPPSTASSPL